MTIFDSFGLEGVLDFFCFCARALLSLPIFRKKAETTTTAITHNKTPTKTTEATTINVTKSNFLWVGASKTGSLEVFSKKFDLVTFIVVASVVFVGAALCVVAVVLVAMLARKVHQNRSMRTSQPKSARQQITTTQSLKERPSIIMSDESYEEPVRYMLQ
jgi:beta-lactamase regulating signal transducer with metallopeptidase domain